MIKVTKYTELDFNTKDSLNRIIEDEFGHIPIVKETEWAIPDWTIILYVDGEIATFYNIIERNIFIDNDLVKIAGINNVITPQKFRGKGYASKVLKETENFIFEDLKSQNGVLLCADELIPFYKKLGWYKVVCPVFYKQTQGEKLWSANAMLLGKEKLILPKEINLNGLPW